MLKPRLSPGLTLVLAVALVPAGLTWGGTARGAAPESPRWSAEQRKHWAYVPPKRPEVPGVKGRDWVRNPVDTFVLAGMESIGVAPAPEADRLTLIRRVTFDLTGLPPTPAEVDAFVNDKGADAYGRLVDRLLKSERYGERWARMWLDLARYAESDGFKSDKTRPSAWRYRDWVIRALNDDMPYDRFLALQLAGDEIAPGDPGAFVATGFNRNWPFEDNNKVVGLNRQLMLEDMTDTTASVVLGMTVACARCHDHKYDPISQKDYYRFQALFAASTPKDDAPLVPPIEQAFFAAVASEHKARVDQVKKALTAIERPYQGALLEKTFAKLPPEVRQAFATSPEERSAFQDDLLKQYAKEMTVAPKAMETVMKPADRRAWNDLGGEMRELARALPPAPPRGAA